MPGVKTLEKRGFTLYKDSQYYIFKREEMADVLFDQIKIKIDSGTVRCSRYIFTKADGYKEEPLSLDTDILSAILIVIREIKKKGITNERQC